MCIWRLIKVPHGDRKSKTRTCYYLSSLLIAFFQFHAIATIAVAGSLLSTSEVSCTFMRSYQTPFYVFLVSGIIAFTVCVVWAVVMLSNNNKMPLARVIMVCVITVAILELISAILAGVYNERLKNELSQDMQESIERITSGSMNDKKAQESVDCWKVLQTKLECCGGSNYSDWETSPGSVFGNISSTSPIMSTILESCSCTGSSSCVTIGNTTTVFASSCKSEFSSDMAGKYLVVRIMAPVMMVFKMASFVLFYYVMLRLQQQTAIDIYKVKQPPPDVTTVETSEPTEPGHRQVNVSPADDS